MKYVYSLIMIAGLFNCCETKKVNNVPWPAEKAWNWYKNHEWIIGANYIPSNAINQLEMWQEATFSPEIIRKELGYAKAIGFNSMRVFLHNLLWEEDSAGFLKRIHQYLEISDSLGISTMLVLFDGVWHPFPKLGKQPNPIPYTHNSGWVQTPGADYLNDTTKYSVLENYVKGIIQEFSNDKRVILWDLFNEPDNINKRAYKDIELKNKEELAFKLLKNTFDWAREVNPSQPITVAPWNNLKDTARMNIEIYRYMFENSDIISFHSYDNIEGMANVVENLKKYNRPKICTEYMARPNCTFQNTLPLFKSENIGCYNWGFVNGKSQTIYPWISWNKKFDSEPDIWFHDLLHSDGKPYDTSEMNFIKDIILVK